MKWYFDFRPYFASMASLLVRHSNLFHRSCCFSPLLLHFSLHPSYLSQPTEAKYRSIKKTNPAFLRRLGSLPGGPDLLFAAGFVTETKDDVDGRTEYYVLTPSAVAWPRLVAARGEVGRALSGVEAGGIDRRTHVGGVGGASPNANPPPLPAFPGAPAIQSMLRDPNMVRNMMGMMNVSITGDVIKNIHESVVHNVCIRR